MSAIATLLVDLDGTLYPILEGNDYEHHVRQNVFKFMEERLGVPSEEAVPIWQRAFAKYNQTLKGLREGGYTFDVAEYWDYIRAGAERFLSPDPQVRGFFQSLPQKKWLFTNANEKSARHCLKLLDLEGIFDGVIGADSLGDACKPELSAFQKALEISGASPHSTAMFEDSFKNLRTAKDLGMTTIMVAGETAAEENVTREAAAGVVDVIVTAPTEAQLREKLPDLWH